MSATLDETTTFGERMLALLTEQRHYFVELQKLAAQQRVLIRAQQNEELLRVLARRQKVVDAVGRINRDSAPYRRDWETMKDRLPDTLRATIGGLLGELGTMLNAILEQDRQDCQELSGSKQQVAAEMSRMSQARAANAHYGQPGERTESNGLGSGGFQVTG